MSQEIDYHIPFRTNQQIRKDFIEFFKDRNHIFVPSDTLVPQNDPTIMFTNSGMNQFKGIFLGDNPNKWKRTVNSQKCLRVSGKHNDLDEVGRDSYHHTFFEMMGNWSFGDYYKKEAITWAWELLTKVWKMPKERLFASVYKNDDEAFDMWKNHTDIDPSHIMRFDEKSNFWEMGNTGPCGPCSELHFDKGPMETQQETFADPIKGVNGSNDRYIEIWNLVFMQYERRQDGSLAPLAQTHVDTGSGFERICAVIQNKASNYDTDLFQPIIEKIAKITKVPYQKDERGTPHRVIADHIRALSFAIADGVTPGNEGKGYILRRILRRASRFANELGQKSPMLYQLVDLLGEIMGETFSEVKERKDYIKEVIFAEEQRFLKTLKSGLERLEKIITQTKSKNLKEISGEDVFLMHDTFGFPFDLTQLIALERGLDIDHKGFESFMEDQKQRARLAQKFSDDFLSDELWEIVNQARDTEFLGYESLETTANVLRYRDDGKFIYVVLDKSPFYAEAGGQCGDTGRIENSFVSLKVVETLYVLSLRVHKCELLSGLVSTKTMTEVKASVDRSARLATAKNHSATHLLQAALKKVLGEHVNQQGSYVGPDRLRFDFTHHSGLAKDDLKKTEDLVNQQIANGFLVQTDLMSLEAANASGAQALFGEKYSSNVRVLTMGDFSKELCGGTHVQNTAQIGAFKIIAESSVAAGVRRIEAITGTSVLELLSSCQESLVEISKSLKVPLQSVCEKVNELLQRGRDKDRELEKLYEFKSQMIQKQYLAENTPKVLDNGKYSVICGIISPKDLSKEQFQGFLDSLTDKLESEIALVLVAAEQETFLLISVGKKAVESLKTKDIISRIQPHLEIKGGGRPNKAQCVIRSHEPVAIILQKLQHAF